MNEDALLTGPLEPTNRWYAIAKIAGIKLCQACRRQYGCNFVGVMPTSLYGPIDNYGLTASHMIPALLVKADRAKTDGASFLGRRMSLCAQAYDGEEHLNIGAGTDVTIRELAELVCQTVGFGGELRFDASKPDGTPRKLTDVSRLTHLGWSAKIGLREGLAAAYKAFLGSRATGQARLVVQPVA